MSRILAGSGLAVLALALSGCGLMGDPWSGEKGVRVIVTIPALESFTRAVGGEHVSVKCLCTKTGPHEFKADAADLSAFAGAQLVLGVGLSLDDKPLRDLQAMARRGKALPFVKVGQLLPAGRIRELEHGHGHDHEGHDHKGHDHKGHEGHNHGKYDPHVWLGVPEAILMVEIVRDELGKADPDNAETYVKNAKAYTEELKKLQAEGVAAFKEKGHSLITFHGSFGYFANAFKLEIAAVMEETPGDNPDPANLAKIIEKVKNPEKGKLPVGCITVEPQYAEGSVKKVIAELKAKGLTHVRVAKVDPMETGEPKDLVKEGGGWYIDRMKKNIKAIKDALP